MPSLFAVPFADLTLDRLSDFLEGAEPEPLLWEAKGGRKLDAHTVRKQVGGFANSHEGGYLILGASEEDGRWTLDGWPFPDDEPPRWVTSCLQEGVRPLPRYDVRSFDVNYGRRVAVVEIDPLDAGPCIVRGTVYERVPGATIAVKDPQRLADLFSRGEQAHRRASEVAANARAVGVDGLKMLTNWEEQREDERGTGKTFIMAFGLATTAGARDSGPQLFRASTRELLLHIGQDLGASGSPIAPEMWPQIGQDRRTLLVHQQSQYATDWAISAFWDGSIGLACRAIGGSGYADSIINDVVTPAYMQALKIAEHLGIAGARYIEVMVLDGAFPPLTSPVTIRRGPIETGSEPDWESMLRELDRAMGNDTAEPEG